MTVAVSMIRTPLSFKGKEVTEGNHGFPSVRSPGRGLPPGCRANARCRGQVTEGNHGWGKGGYGGKPWKVSLCSWSADARAIRRAARLLASPLDDHRHQGDE